MTVQVLLPVDLCADVAIDQWGQEEAVILVAIAGAETGGSWNQYAAGDNPDDIAAYVWDRQHPGLPREGPEWDALLQRLRDEYLPHACNGFTSFGLWQINLRWNDELVGQLSGYIYPCDLAAWLYVRQNNARAARAVYDRQTKTAWTTYNVQSHLRYIDAARAAVIAALIRAGQVPQPPLVTPGPPVIPGPFDFAAFESLAPVEPPGVAVEPPVAAVDPP